LGSLSSLVGDAVSWMFVAVASPLLAVFSRFGKPIITAAVLLTAGIMFVRSLDISSRQHQRVLDQLTAAGDRLQELRNKTTSDAEWAEFSEQTRTWLRPELAELQLQSRRFPLQRSGWFEFERLNARTRNDLIRAGNALDKELDAGPLNIMDAVAFHALLREAQDTFVGNEFRGWNRPREPASPASDLTALTIGFIVFDILLLIGGAAYWLRKKRARAA
jgi:hypothetical protein